MLYIGLTCHLRQNGGGGGGAAVFIFRFTVYVIVKCFSIELSGQWYTQVHCAFINLVLNMGYITVNSSVQN